jgi:hypothetical protein
MRLPCLIACVSLAGCYAPELADCTVTCSAEDDCAADQICAEGMCRAPEATCEGDQAPRRVELKVEVVGAGVVIVETFGTCGSSDSDDDDKHTCKWQVPVGAELRLEARPVDDDPFERWTSAACADQGTICMFVATKATSVGARFR